MNVNTYEGLFLLDSNRYARDPAIADEIVEAIEKAGGEIKVSRLWDERRLAYPINKMRKGTYWLVYFSIDTQKMVELNRTFQLNENVVRLLFVKLHPRLAEAIVGHASGADAVPVGVSGEGEAATGDKKAEESGKSVAVAAGDDAAAND